MSVKIVKVPEKANVLTLTSPSFTMRRPLLHNSALIPSTAMEAMESSWNTAFFAERPITFSLINDVYVVEEGLVFSAEGELLQSSITQHSEGEIHRGYTAVQNALKEQKVYTSHDPVILCKKRGCQNYGHWLIEMLPKAFLAKLYLDSPTMSFAIPAVEGKLQDTINQSLDLLSIGGVSVIPISDSVHRFASIIIVDGITNHGTYMSPLVLSCLDALSARVNSRGVDRLLVKRVGIKSRQITNESDLDNLAADRGFTAVDPSGLTFAQQIQEFKSASKVIGVMGAAMTNIAFAPSDACIINLAPAAMPDTFFWFLAGLRRQKYTELRCLQVGPVRGTAPWDTDIVVDIKELESAFR